jgi:aspartyl-tRNA(Asn)/glutamyl-tRNA(Gln) amidotransferase subunit A
MLARRLDPIHAVAAAYRRRARSPVDVTRAALARVDAVDDGLSAFLSVWHDDALRSARLAEEELASGVDRGPRHGVPVAVKDLIDVAGRVATYGSKTVPDPTTPEAEG